MNARTLPGPTIAPGVYPSLGMGEYHASGALSSSGLGYVGRSMSHYLEYRTNGGDRPAFAFGRAVHDLVADGELGPDYVVSDFGSYRAKDAKEWRDEQLEAGRTILTAAQQEGVYQVADNIAAHPYAASMLAAGERECSYVWDDDGILCRVRPDCYVWSSGVVIDLKTTRDASAEKFRKSAANFKYHRQAAFYWRGLRAHGHQPSDHVIIAAENEAPYGVAVYHLEAPWIVRGGELVDECMSTVRHWLTGEDEHDGYPQTIQLLTMPTWA